MYSSFITFLMVYGSLLLALILNLMAPPKAIAIFFPNIFLLMIMFWAVKIPRMVSIGHAFVCGLILDFAIGSTMGIRAFSFSLMIYMLSSAFSRLDSYSLLQQALCIGIISFLGQIATFWLEHAFGLAIIDFHTILSVISDVILWPLLWVSMSFVMRFRHVVRNTGNEL
ncbi:MAG: rod shape-determining protein MreD [Succinivibrionaceae bacterium]